MTADLLIEKPETMTDATGVNPVEYETITTPGEQVEGTPITTAPTTEKFPISFSTGTYAFDELFPKSKSLDLDIGEVRQLDASAEKSFRNNKTFKNRIFSKKELNMLWIFIKKNTLIIL